MSLGIPYHHQKNCYFCGPTCLKMALEIFGKKRTEDEIAKLAGTTAERGTPHHGMIEACNRLGLSCFVHENANMATVKAFLKARLPVIINWTDNKSEIGHYSVMAEVAAKNVFFCDPWYGPKYAVDKKVFEKYWHDGMTRGNRWMMAILPEGTKITQDIRMNVDGKKVLVKAGRVYKPCLLA